MLSVILMPTEVLQSIFSPVETNSNYLASDPSELEAFEHQKAIIEDRPKHFQVI